MHKSKDQLSSTIRHRAAEEIVHLQKSGKFFLGVEDHDHEGRSWDVLSAPLDLDAVVAGLGGLVLAQDGSVLLRFSLHFDPEST